MFEPILIMHETPDFIFFFCSKNKLTCSEQLRPECQALAFIYLFIFPPHTSFNFFLKTDVETKSQTKLGSPPRAAPPVSGGLAASLVLSLFMLLLAEKGQYTAPFRHREDPTPGSVGRRAVFPIVLDCLSPCTGRDGKRVTPHPGVPPCCP